MNEIIYEDLETLPSFTPQFPTEEIYNYRSYLTPEGVSYFVKDPSVNPTLPVDSYAHIDPLMRYFVYLMHVNGMFVTAAWQGVSDPKEYFDRLKVHEQQIQRAGMQMFDFFSGEEFFFKDKSYRAPFSTIDDFAALGDEVRHDRIGLLVPTKNAKVVKNLSEEPYETGLSSIAYERELDIDGTKFAYYPISVRREDDRSRMMEWRQLSSWILSNLEKKAVLDESYLSRR